MISAAEGAPGLQIPYYEEQCRASCRGPARATYEASALVHICSTSNSSSGVGCRTWTALEA